MDWTNAVHKDCLSIKSSDNWYWSKTRHSFKGLLESSHLRLVYVSFTPWTILFIFCVQRKGDFTSDWNFSSSRVILTILRTKYGLKTIEWFSACREIFIWQAEWNLWVAEHLEITPSCLHWTAFCLAKPFELNPQNYCSVLISEKYYQHSYPIFLPSDEDYYFTTYFNQT